MSEAAPEATATEAASSEQPAEAPRPTETVDFWKQKAREQETRAKSNAEAAQRLQQLEDAQKTEAQRQADAIAAAQRDAEAARSEVHRYKAAATHGVSADYVDLLGTGSEDEIAARAERLGALVKQAGDIDQLRAEIEALRAGKPAPTAGRPTTALKPGATPEQHQTEDDATYAALFGSQ